MQRILRYSFFFLLSGFATYHLSSQEVRYRSDLITRESGLSGSSVSSIIRDKYGFIWIGTWNGLNRFDGYEMTVFQPRRGDSTSLSNSNINSLFEDREGLLWVATDNGLNSYDQNTGKFTRYHIGNVETNEQHYRQFNSIAQDKDGRIWLGTQGEGLICMIKDNGVLEKFHNGYSEGSNIIYTVHADNKNDDYIWLGTADGLFRFKRSTGLFDKISDGIKEGPLSVQVIRQDIRGDLFMGTWGRGLIKYDRHTSTLSVCYPGKSTGGFSEPGIIRAMEFDKQGNLVFVVRDMGLMNYNPVLGTISKPDAREIENELNTKVVTTMYIEPSGTIWIGTIYDGALKLVKLINSFSHYVPLTGDGTRSIRGGVSAILEDSDGLLWLGTRFGGVSVIDRITLERKIYQQSARGLSSNNIRSLLETKENGRKTIWIGTDGGGLNRLDVAKGSFTVFSSNNMMSSGLNSNSISSLTAYDSDHLLIGTGDRNLGEGLYVFNIKTGKFVNMRYREHDSSSLGSNNILKIIKDKEGNVWVGTRNGGLNKFIVRDINSENPEEIGYFIRYMHDPADPSSLENNTIYSIHNDSNGNLWLGTNGGGLTRFKPSTGTFESNILGQYIKDQIVYGILADDHENLWISTSRGIISLNINTKEVHSFDKYDGLQETAFIYGSYFKSASGEMFFGGIHGCNTFHPDSIRLNLKVPPIVITSLDFTGKKGNLSASDMTGKSVIAFKTIEIPYYQNNFSVTFSALDYQMPARNRFRYILEGYDKVWSETDARRRYVNYTNLPPGKYKFRVIGSNSDDIWNHEGTSVNIIIKPPFWNTSLFYIMVSAVIAGFIAILILFLLNKNRKEKRKLELEALSSVQDEKKQLRTLVDNIPDDIFIKDRQSRFTLANKKVAAVMGTTPENLIGKTDFDFYPEEIAKAFFDDEQKIIDTGVPMINFEETAHDEHGNRIIRSTTKVPIRNNEGIIIGIAGVCRDITKLKKIENQLRKKSDDLLETNRLLEGRQKEILMQSEALALQTQNLMITNTELERLNRTKDKFFSIIAHDLRNPFNAIIGFSELLRADFNDMDDNQKINLLELINLSSQTAYNLLENLLQWARTQTDNISYNPVRFDLVDSAKTVVDLHCGFARKKGLKIKNQIDARTLVYADENMVSTVLRNLVSNAIKFSNPNGEIVISSNRRSGMVEINVTDSGIGMDRESLSKLFRIDTYYSTSGTMGESGTGLGLIICKEFVEKNSGRIRASSSEGVGTTVTFTLTPATIQ